VASGSDVAEIRNWPDLRLSFLLFSLQTVEGHNLKTGKKFGIDRKQYMQKDLNVHSVCII
jgi:hypothetical protein